MLLLFLLTAAFSFNISEINDSILSEITDKVCKSTDQEWIKTLCNIKGIINGAAGKTDNQLIIIILCGIGAALSLALFIYYVYRKTCGKPKNKEVIEEENVDTVKLAEDIEAVALSGDAKK